MKFKTLYIYKFTIKPKIDIYMRANTTILRYVKIKTEIMYSN